MDSEKIYLTNEVADLLDISVPAIVFNLCEY